MISSLLGNALYCGLVVALGLYCWFRWRHRDLLRVASQLPVTLPAWPLLGHGYIIFWGIEGGTNFIFEMIYRGIEKGMKTICVWVGPKPFIALLDLEDIRVVMNSAKTLDKSEEYQLFKEGLDCGCGYSECSLLISPGPVWKVTRKHMNAMFTPRNLELMMSAFNDNARTLVARIDERVGRGPTRLDLTYLVMDTALKSVCDLLFGLDNKIDIYSEEFQGLKTVVERISVLFMKRVLYPWLSFYPVFIFFYRKEVEEINRLLKNFTKTPLQETKQKYESRNNNPNHGSSENKRHDLLNIVEVFTALREKHPQFTEANMWSEMLTLYETGSDTIAVIFSFCVMALAQYPEYQDKVYQEIDSVVGSAADVTVEHVTKLTYLEQCIKETLRRFTIVPIILRKTSEDIKLSECTVPANCTVAMPIFSVHMNPRIYPDPRRFDPDRFSPENDASRGRFSFLGFSAGPRNCIGKRYGMMLLKVMLVNIVRRYRLKPVLDVQKLRLKLIVVLTSCEGYPVGLELRATS